LYAAEKKIMFSFSSFRFGCPAVTDGILGKECGVGL